jgi:hypothetical protein
MDTGIAQVGDAGWKLSRTEVLNDSAAWGFWTTPRPSAATAPPSRSVGAVSERFGPATAYPSPDSFWVVSGDFSGDGIPDLISNESGNGIFLLRGLGGGEFAPPVEVGSTNDDRTGRAVAVDLNRDGKLDLVVASRDAAAFYVWLGNGNGTFRQFNGTEYYNGTTAGVLVQVAVADFNSDDWPDLVAVGLGPTNGRGLVQLWLNNGDGTFHLGASFIEGSRLSAVATGDLNRDGHADFMVADLAGDVVPFYGNGQSGFTRGIPVSTSAPNYLALADVNGDGRLDALVSNYSSRQVSIFVASDSSHFRAMPPVPVGNVPNEIAVANFVHSGRPGFAVANSADGTVSVFAGNGTGAFSSLGTYVMSAGDPGFSEFLPSVVAVDLNGDGRMDLAAANEDDHGTVFVRLALKV